MTTPESGFTLNFLLQRNGKQLDRGTLCQRDLLKKDLRLLGGGLPKPYLMGDESRALEAGVPEQ